MEHRLNDTDRGKQNYWYIRVNWPSDATLLTKKLTKIIPVSNPDLRGKKPSTTYLSHGCLNMKSPKLVLITNLMHNSFIL
jgi:hypothetical protein